MIVPPIQLGSKAFWGRQKMIVLWGAFLAIQSWGVTPTEAHSFSPPPLLNLIDVSLTCSFTGGTMPHPHCEFLLAQDTCVLQADRTPANEWFNVHRWPWQGLAGGFLDWNPGEGPICRGESMPAARFMLSQLCIIAASLVLLLGSSWCHGWE